MNLDFKNLYPNPTTYSYSVYVHVTTFGADPGKHESYCHEEIFESENLLDARINAVEYYYQTLMGLMREGNKYFLPFAGPDEFELGKHAAFSLYLFFIHTWGDMVDEYCLLGGEEDEMVETRENEKFIFNQLGLSLNNPINTTE